MDIQELTLDEWGNLLPNTGVGPFHEPDLLALMNEYEDGELRLLGGLRGEQPVALMPAFVREAYGFRFVISPPPGFSVPWLGPVLMPASPKQRKRDKLNERFIEQALATLDAGGGRTLFGMVASPQYTDARPFLWEGHDVEPRYNYVLELAGDDTESVLSSFTADLRKEVRKGEELDVTIELEGEGSARRICGDLKDRYAEQGLKFQTPQSFAGDIVEQFDGNSRVYVARSSDGEYLSGITVLHSESDAIFWQGGTKTNYDGVSVNSLLHWAIIEDILEDPALAGVERYHLGNGLNRRISRYKSKFDAEPVANYEIKSTLMRVARKAHDARRHLTSQRIKDRVLDQ